MVLISSMLFGLCSYLIYLVWKQKKKEKELMDEGKMKLEVPDGPCSLPIVGNMIQLGERPYEKMFKWSEEYGPVFKIYLGSQLVVVLNGTQTIREALVDHAEEFAGRPHLYMIHATLKGKGIISSPYNQDFNEHKKFLINTINKVGRRRSSLEVNCLQTIRETLDEYRERIDNNFEYTNNQMKNSLSQIASQNVLTMTFGTRMHDKKTFSTLMDLITENFRNTAVAAAFNFLPLTRIFKKYILKNVMCCSEFLNNLVSEKMEEYNEEIDDHFLNEKVTHIKSTESNIIECYLKELMNSACMLNKIPLETINSSSRTSSFGLQARRLTEKEEVLFQTIC